MRLGVLGPLAVWSADGTSVGVPGIKVRALLADLISNGGRPLSSARLVEDVWGEQAPSNAAGSLQAKVSQLRRVLDTAEPGGRSRLRFYGGGYALRTDADTVDADRFAALTARAEAEDALRTRVSLLTEALALFRGGPYSDFADADFARAAAARLDEQRAAALEGLAEARLELGEHRLLVGELETLIADHPLRERLRKAQLLALYRSGRQAEALGAFDRLRELLRSELGVDPSPELAELHQAMLRQDPALLLEPETPRLRQSTNLPAPLVAEPDGGLVGREGAVADVRARLASGRLVTLTGTGGVGKTRLAIESARDSEDYPDGVWIVELAAQRFAEHAGTLAEATLAVLGIREDTGMGVPAGWEYAEPGERLACALRDKRLLLVLDNCEHVIDAASELVGRVLRRSPEVRVLATSREPLGVSGELLYPVQPLELPQPGCAETADEVQLSAAVRLFTAQAAAVAPGFAVDADNARAVAAVCRRLDGIPLALELAATRLPALGIHTVAARLGDRFSMLTAGRRGAPERQQTLRAVVDWSWELLGPQEQAVLRRLAVHADGCTLAAAEHVSAGGEVAAADVLDLLVRLVDRSLVTRGDAGAPSRPTAVDARYARAEPRYRLLESVAAYCAERLDAAGEAEDVRLAHARYYTLLAERARPHLRGREQRVWLECLDAESADLRRALDTAIDQRVPELALRLVDSLAWYWLLRGRHGEARRSLAAALDLADTALSSGAYSDSAFPDGATGRDSSGGTFRAARAEAMAWLAGAAFMTYDDTDPATRSSAAFAAYERVDDPHGLAHAQWLVAFTRLGSGALSVSEDLVQRALAGFRRSGDRWGIAAALSTRAELGLSRGDLGAARSDCDEGSSLFRELGDRWGQIRIAQPMGILAEVAGDYTGAAQLSREALRMAEELALWPSVSAELAKLGRLALLTHDFAEAERFHEQALDLAASQGDGSAAAFARTGLGLGARRQGQLDAAEGHLSESLAWNRRTGYQPGVALVLAELGFTAEMRGRASEARDLHTQGLAAARETGDPRAVALALEGLAGAACVEGAYRRSARLLGAAAAARESVGTPLPSAEQGDVARISRELRRAMGEEALSAESAQGALLDPADAAL